MFPVDNAALPKGHRYPTHLQRIRYARGRNTAEQSFQHIRILGREVRISPCTVYGHPKRKLGSRSANRCLRRQQQQPGHRFPNPSTVVCVSVPPPVSHRISMRSLFWNSVGSLSSRGIFLDTFTFASNQGNPVKSGSSATTAATPKKSSTSLSHFRQETVAPAPDPGKCRTDSDPSGHARGHVTL